MREINKKQVAKSVVKLLFYSILVFWSVILPLISIFVRPNAFDNEMIENLVFSVWFISFFFAINSFVELRQIGRSIGKKIHFAEISLKALDKNVTFYVDSFDLYAIPTSIAVITGCALCYIAHCLEKLY